MANTGNYNASREAALYCATTNAKIRNGESTWDYRDGDGQRYEVTARVNEFGDVVTTVRKG